uniref:diphthine methyl ester synthase n=1 Tax=Hirondellea gigas TaxID=1518452 RepID=A0A6A7G0F1_9CRUS
MFYLIGLGLGDPSDVSIKGKQIIKRCQKVYLEAYTSIMLHGAKEDLEAYYGRSIDVADREMVEQNASELMMGTAGATSQGLADSSATDVALLVVGDPLGATTHTDLILRAKKNGIPVSIINNASVLTAVGLTGLDMHRFGEVVSIPFWEETWKPKSFYDKIAKNLKDGLHTLCLLDIKVKEQSVENIVKNRKIFEPPRFMRTDQAATQLLQIVYDIEAAEEDPVTSTDADTCSTIDCVTRDRKLKKRSADSGATCSSSLLPDSTCIACVRLGSPKQQNVFSTLQGLCELNLGEPLHSMVVCSQLTDVENCNCKSLAQYFTGCNTETNAASPDSGYLQLVGLGLSLDDLTVKGLNAIKQASVTFIDEQTRLILRSIQPEESDLFKNLSGLINEDDLKCLQTVFDLQKTGFRLSCDSEMVLESLRGGKNVAIVVWGDPLVFTDYCTLVAKVINENLHFNVIHNTSVMNSIACCGLQLYSFGETIQFPLAATELSNDACLSVLGNENSFYNKIDRNLSKSLHTLCLLHGSQESSCESSHSLSFVKPNEAAAMLIKVQERKKESSNISGLSSLAIGIAGLGGSELQLKTCTLKEMTEQEFNAGPVYALIIVGATHPLENDCLRELTEKI